MKTNSEDAARKREALLQFESVKRWMSCETINSSRTRQAYLKYLQILTDHFGCDPDELVAQRIEDMAQRDFTRRQRIEESVRTLKAKMAKEDGETKAFMLVAAACSFFKANTGARLNINNPNPEVKNEAWTYQGEPSGEQDFWRNVVDHAPTMRDAALFLIGLETGPRDGSVLAMTIGDVINEFAMNAAPYKIRIPALDLIKLLTVLKDGINQKDAAEELDLNEMTVSRIARELEQHGYIKRVTRPRRFSPYSIERYWTDEKTLGEEKIMEINW